MRGREERRGDRTKQSKERNRDERDGTRRERERERGREEKNTVSLKRKGRKRKEKGKLCGPKRTRFPHAVRTFVASKGRPAMLQKCHPGC